jgi:hypothetical protein
MNHLFNFAYLDPGTGSMVIQSLIGIVAGIALFGRKALTSVRMRLKKNQKESSKS